MARNHRRSATPARPAPTQSTTQTRSASTAAAPVAHAAPQPMVIPQQQGIMSQIATTAAGVAAGHVAGRMVMGLFGGGESSAPAEMQQPAQTAFQQDKAVAPQCQEYSKMFLSCMDRNSNEFGMCSDYMEMMKACQQQYS